MSTISEIKSKYSLDGAVSVTVDLESMRDDARSTLNNADEFVKDATREADRGIPRSDKGIPRSDKEWMNRRKARITNYIRDQKRKVALAQKYIDEINGMLDKANENIAKVK